MADRFQWFQGQYPTNLQMNAADDGLERADRAIATDFGFFGVVVGGVVAQAIIPNLTVVVAGPTVAYDQSGQRIYVPAPITVDVSKDYLGVNTAVLTNGNHKILSIFAKFKRNPSGPDTDSETPPQTVYFNQPEGYQLVVYQGAEGGSPSPPALLGDGVLLCDVTINCPGGVPQTAVHTDGSATGGSPSGHDVSFARAQVLFAISHAGTWAGIGSTSLLGALTAISAELDTVSASGVLNYLGSNLTAPTGAWADASNLAAQTTVGGALSNAVGVLGSASGAAKLGTAAIVGVSSTLSASAVQTVLAQLKSASNHDMPAAGNWADGTTNPAALLSTFLTGMISGLASTTGGASGAHKVGSASIVGAVNTVASGTLYSQLTALKSAANHDCTAGPAWLDSTTNAAGTVQARINKIITDLISTTSGGGDGASKLGFNSGAGLTSSNVSAAIDEIMSLLAQQTNPTGETRVGGRALTGSSGINLSAGTLEARLQAIINAASPSVDVQLITSNGSWAPPSWILSTSVVDVLLVGTGGSGGGGPSYAAATSMSGGSGAGGGANTRRTFTYGAGFGGAVSVTLGAQNAVGAAGTPSADGGDGNAGGQSTFGTLLRAAGGVGGAGGNTGPSAGGSGGGGEFPGGAGGDGTAGAVGGAAPSTAPGAAGGGAGGGVSNTNTARGGGAGGVPVACLDSAVSGGIGGNPGAGGAPSAPAVPSTSGPGRGGGGGGGAVGGPGGNGGAGVYGGGGGGGGAAQNGFVPGTGGLGGKGFCLVVTRR